ncbi:chorismate pyruvate-lyase family protein, partial [Moorena sp. SIO3B2]
PIGKIWREQRFETFKEIVDTGKKPANELADYFQIEPEANLLFRTYCVFSNRQSVMMISEYFPESYFLNRL